MYKFKFSKILIMVLSAINMTAVAWAMEKPVTLVDQGSFAAGGTVTKVMGNFDYSNRLIRQDKRSMEIMLTCFIKFPHRRINIRLSFFMVPGSPNVPGKQLQMEEMVFRIFFWDVITVFI